ncbi:MAG TPA: hypothetical protein VFE12_07155, partial [Acetobacteraceae bacterium]|nr:hypothetical protein [Acetobacteraceae bacterium]
MPASTGPQNQPPAGMRRAVEMWIVTPQLAQQGQGLIAGMGQQVGAMALSALQAQFPKGWQRARTATAAEQAFAKSLLPRWQDGKVVFGGGSTLTTARAFQFTKHPAAPGSQPATVPASTSAPPTVPASVPASTAPPAFPAQVPVPASAPPAPTVTPGTVKLPDGSTVTTRPDGSKVTTLPEVLITAD